jgi:2-polyprenyl-6-methoxyphenol hydroxylase-like FAD-dependent oxidoreductase
MSDSTPVLIVGGGPVGLALAGDLGWRGVECLLVEQSDGSIYQPRQDFVGIRTMEFCRRWGLVSAVEASPYPRDVPQDNVYVTSLTGYELGREPFPSMGDEKPPPASPQKRERCPQNMFDPILRAFASSHPCVELRYRTRLLSFVQDRGCVTATVEDLDGARRYEIAAQYIVGCDGARSLVRDTLGIGMTGNPALTYTTNIIFRCPHLVSLHDKGLAYRFIILGPDGVWATIVAINGRDQWRMSIVGDAEPRELTREEIHAAIRRAVGIDFDYEILTILPWVRRELVADRFRSGRGFILGDAAHAMSPTGGFGMNTGLGDAVDLSWKLTATLEGWGGPALLDTYETERRPVGARNVAEASRNLRRMLAPRHNPALLDDTDEGARTRARVGREFSDAMRHEWYTLGMHLGYRYEGSPICWPDRTEAPPDDPKNYVPTARPGHRAPHAWLADGRSTLDLFGRGFTLLDLRADASDVVALRAAAQQRRLPMRVECIDAPQVLALYERRLVLVRPDGHVAWRDDRAPAEPARLIDCARGAIPNGVTSQRHAAASA